MIREKNYPCIASWPSIDLSLCARIQKLAEVPSDDDASEAEVLQTLEVIKNSGDHNKDDAAMLLV